VKKRARTPAEAGIIVEGSGPLPPLETAREREAVDELALLAHVPEAKREILRATFVASVAVSLTGESAEDALREMQVRELGPQWLRDLCKERPADALRLMSRTLRWVLTQGARQAAPDDQREFWNRRCALHLTVMEVARKAQVDPGWAHKVEQGEIKATKAQMLALWGVLWEWS
jgi:hypothetical protein